MGIGSDFDQRLFRRVRRERLPLGLTLDGGNQALMDCGVERANGDLELHLVRNDVRCAGAMDARTVTTAGAAGSFSRDTMACRPSTMRTAITTGSIALFGNALGRLRALHASYGIAINRLRAMRFTMGAR